MDERKAAALGRLLDVMDRLRVECPWDREQTFLSLRNNTIEEAYELTEAIERGDMSAIREELGDVLLHIVFYSRMGDEQGAFDIADVANAICDKLIYRHPHVFGEVNVENADEVTRNWEQLKLQEKKRAGGVLSGVPASLPAMIKAYRVSQKAASAGFDWPSREEVWAKVREEAGELEAELRKGDREAGCEERASGSAFLLRASAVRASSKTLGLASVRRATQALAVPSSIPAAPDTSAPAGTAGDHVAGNHAAIEEEMGDLFFALVNAARLYGIDPELALERCNKKFIRRFQYIEARVADAGHELRDLSPEQWEELWQQAKTTDKQ